MANSKGLLDTVSDVLNKASDTISEGIKTEVTVNVPKSVYLNLLGTALVAAFCILLLMRLFRTA